MTIASDRMMRDYADKQAFLEAIKIFRFILVKEGGVPRYTVTPGAALNSFIEETIDPLLRKHGVPHGYH
jgi:hypothetical protein